MEAVETVDIEFEDGPRIRAYLYPDASIRFRLYGAAPVVVTEASLTTGNVVLKVTPRPDNDRIIEWDDGTRSWDG